MGSTSSNGSRAHGPASASGGGQRRRAAPEAEVPEDSFHHFALVNHGNDAHGVLAFEADQWVGVPHFSFILQSAF
jgi:hypothetical protein